MVSASVPFASAGNAEAAPAVAMTVETVDRALEEVRPYLIADGGNVTVLDVVDGTVMLQLDVSSG
jgi:NFU1 iron-sulfur cluster scaffold homolog, mitochondrial